MVGAGLALDDGGADFLGSHSGQVRCVSHRYGSLDDGQAERCLGANINRGRVRVEHRGLNTAGSHAGCRQLARQNGQ